MGNPTEVKGVNVIQYFKNESFTTASGKALATAKGPKDTQWQWAAGTDGWKVDSDDDIRCWPDSGAADSRSLKRDATAGTVKWSDTPGVDLQTMTAGIKDGTYQEADFPLTYSADFKTPGSRSLCGRKAV